MMSWTSRVLADISRDYIDSVSQTAGEYRLVIPGLTSRIGEELHDLLRQAGFTSYLVIGNLRIPSEERRWLRPISLTTKRIGSFIAISDPGALSEVQDSIRGSGGAIRSTAFSEEWPWIDDGSDSFRFSAAFVPRLAALWSQDPTSRDWLDEILCSMLLEATERGRERSGLLLDRIIGLFDPESPSELSDIRSRFLFHCGIPDPGEEIESIPRVKNGTRVLARRIVDRTRSEPDLRDQVLKNADLKFSDIPGMQPAIHAFFDGLADPSSLNADVLSLRSCWGSAERRLHNWTVLTSARLRQLFEIEEHGPVQLQCKFEPSEQILLSDDAKKAAGRWNVHFPIRVKYDIPIDEFHPGNSEVSFHLRTHQLSTCEITAPSGELPLDFLLAEGATHKSRLPLRISISLNGEVRAEDRLAIHCCGPDRPAFVVTSPDFFVDDAEEVTEDDPAPERRHVIGNPIRLHLFANDDLPCEVTSDDEEIEQLIRNDGIWKTADTLDVFDQPAGQATYRCQLGPRWVSLTFEAADIERGEFTLEDEFRRVQASGKLNLVREILNVYQAKTDAYSRLGGLNRESRRRTRFARFFEARGGWSPVLVDLFKEADETEGACGDFVRTVGDFPESSTFRSLQLPDDALELLRGYSEARNKFHEAAISTARVSKGVSEFPEYAVFPGYLDDVSNLRDGFEQSLVTYLLAHERILAYLRDLQGHLNWDQVFVLNYLDCLVHWRKDSTKNACFLMGPWHPLICAKRFMVQRALVQRAKRLVDGKDDFNPNLVGLLAQISGFFWYPSLKAEDVGFEPAYVTPTSDPGWHLAFKQTLTQLSTQELGNGLRHLLDKVRSNFGLRAKIDAPSSGVMLDTVLNSFAKTFPGKRHIGTYFPSGFSGEDEISTSDHFLHTEDGPTTAGMQYPGGISLIFGNTPSIAEDTQWTRPPLKVFEYDTREDCLSQQHPDIQFSQTANKYKFIDSPLSRQIPRGSAYEAVFTQSVSRLVQGQEFIPQSAVEEWDQVRSVGTGIGESFARNAGLACALIGKAASIVHSASLPLRQETAWTVVPGAVLDPAIFVQYVRDGKQRQMEDRALWDYRVSLSKSSTSFFILSTIPGAFRNAVNGVFGSSTDFSTLFVTELGEIGLAIAGEAMKSGRHALGCIGIVGAVRLFMGHPESNGPLAWTDSSIGFLLPVDAFREMLERDDKVSAVRMVRGKASRRADLIAIRICIPDSSTDPLDIQAVSVECKFSSSSFPAAQVHDALDQAEATTERFASLCALAQRDSGIPERLALLQLIHFGMRISASNERLNTSDRMGLEARLYERILKGAFEYRKRTINAVLVSTEMDLPGVAECNVQSSGLWIRLNRRNWPVVYETESIAAVREMIWRIFNNHSTTVPPIPPQHPSSSPTQSAETPTQPIASAPVNVPEQAAPGPHVTDTAREEGDGQNTDAVRTVIPSDTGIVLKPILVGVDTSRSLVYFDPHSPVDRLDNANVMVTGSSGKGKTQLLKYLITAIRKQGANTFILDFKNDFASDAPFVSKAGLSSILVAFDGMPFNPLIPYPIKDPRSGRRFVQCAQHIAGVCAVLRRTYGLGPQQEAGVKNSIRQAYSEVGVDPGSTVEYDPQMRFPDLARVGELLEHGNPAAYNRLDPLFTLGLFRDQTARFSFSEMVNRSAAVDFSQIPSDPLKNALAELVVLSAHAYYNSQPHSGRLRQVFIVDEAHRILRADYLERFALECRAYGVSLVLSSQYPSQFPSEISSSLATKVIHGNDRDVERVHEIVNLLGCPGREAEIAELAMFEAIFSNKHFRNVAIRTITYPLFLVLEALQSQGEMTFEGISQIPGLDIHKLSIGNTIRYLERLGICECSNEKVKLVSSEKQFV